MRRFCAVLLLVFGCASITIHRRIARTISIPSTCEGKDADVSIVTYNTGLARGINRLAAEREDLFLSLLPKELKDDDIVVFQEIWSYETIQRVISKLSQSHPYVFFADTRGDGENSEDYCDANSMSDVVSCVKNKCSETRDVDTTACASMRCRTDLEAIYLLHRSCFRCLVASVGKSLDEIQRTCVFERGASKVYGGANGVVLLSKYPLANIEAIHLDASNANRVALFARVDIRGNPVEIVGTHFSSNESVPPMDGGIFATWESERSNQIALVERRLRERAEDGAVQLIIGDMNFGGARAPTISAYGERNWLEVLDLGFWAPSALTDRPLCSFCKGNTISMWTRSILVDGVLVRSKDESSVIPICSERVFTKLVRIGARYENLSDHTGIRARLRIN